MQDYEREMVAYKIRIPQKPVAQLRFDANGLYPGWYVQYQTRGSLRKFALSARSRDEAEEALQEASTLFRCTPDRIRVESD